MKTFFLETKTMLKPTLLLISLFLICGTAQATDSASNSHLNVASLEQDTFMESVQVMEASVANPMVLSNVSSKIMNQTMTAEKRFFDKKLNFTTISVANDGVGGNQGVSMGPTGTEFLPPSGDSGDKGGGPVFMNTPPPQPQQGESIPVAAGEGLTLE